MLNPSLFSSADNEHYTPLDLLFRANRFFGTGIDLDPCSNSRELFHTPAKLHYTQEDDGLTLPWWGKVWVNPPYGNALKDWAEKVRDEYESGNAEEILFLVPSRTDTAWYRTLSAYPRCNINGRLKFYNPGNKGNSAPFPSVIFYLGKRKSKFAESFGEIGQVVAPIAPSRREYQREYQRRRRAKAKINRQVAET